MSMSEVKVQSFESLSGPFYRGQAPKELVLLITHVPESKERVRLYGVNVKQGHIGFAVEANASDKTVVQQRIAGELAQSGGGIAIVWDGSIAATGVIGPGPAPGPGPIGLPDVIRFAGNLFGLAGLDAAGQTALGEWLQSRAG
jgi:hypothetical protein